MHPRVHSSIFTIAKTRKPPKFHQQMRSINRWGNNEDVAHIIQWNITRPDKEWDHTLCGDVDGSRDDHTKRSQRKTNTTRYHLHGEPQLWHKRTYLWNRNKLRDTELTCGCQEGGGWARDGVGSWGQPRQAFIHRTKNSKVPSCSTGNYIQYLGMTHKQKNVKKTVCMCVCVYM